MNIPYVGNSIKRDKFFSDYDRYSYSGSKKVYGNDSFLVSPKLKKTDKNIFDLADEEQSSNKSLEI